MRARIPKGDVFGNECLLLCSSCSMDLKLTHYSWVGEAGSVDKNLCPVNPLPFSLSGPGLKLGCNGIVVYETVV